MIRIRIKAMVPIPPDLTCLGVTVHQLQGVMEAIEDLEVEAEEVQEEVQEAVGTVVRPLTLWPNPRGRLLIGSLTVNLILVWFPFGTDMARRL
jgi:hypothetical protein